jgi:hypothetical protein
MCVGPKTKFSLSSKIIFSPHATPQYLPVLLTHLFCFYFGIFCINFNLFGRISSLTFLFLSFSLAFFPFFLSTFTFFLQIDTDIYPGGRAYFPIFTYTEGQKKNLGKYPCLPGGILASLDWEINLKSDPKKIKSVKET